MQRERILINLPEARASVSGLLTLTPHPCAWPSHPLTAQATLRNLAPRHMPPCTPPTSKCD